MRRLLPVLLGLFALIGSVASHAAGQSATSIAQRAYAEGVFAFQAGDYTRARDAFLRARAAGYTAPRLAYSLGATYYHLGDYRLARGEFVTLLRVPGLAPVSHYNLGLIANKLGDSNTARREFQAAYRQATESGLQALAAAELKRLEHPAGSTSHWYGFANVETGYDDNVALAPQTGLVSASGRGSPLLTLLGGGGGPLSGSYTNGVQLFGSYYQADFPNLSQYDQSMLDGGLQYRHAIGQWALNTALSGGYLTFGGEGFETLATLGFGVGRRVSADNRLKAGYQYQHVAAAVRYDYLSGWQQQLFVEDDITLPQVSAVFGYRHEYNRRNDLTTATQFFSNSPARDWLYAKLKWHYTDALDFIFEAGYEQSRYADPDILVGTSGTTSIKRDDTLYTADIAADYRFSTVWQFETAYRYLNNASNIGFYSYRSNRITASLQYLFY